MLSTQDIYTRGRLRVVWLAAGFKSSAHVKLTRRDYASVDVGEACEFVCQPDQPLGLRLSSRLLVGIARVHHKQAVYVYEDIKQVHQKLYNLPMRLNSIDLQPVQHKSRALITLPDPLEGNLLDLSLENLDLSSIFDAETFFPVDCNLMLLPVLPNTPEGRPGSVQSSPCMADPRDITLTEDPEPLRLENQFLDQNDSFGDELVDVHESKQGPLQPDAGASDPGYLAGQGSLSCEQSGDGIELFDEESGEFRVHWPEQHQSGAGQSGYGEAPDTGLPGVLQMDNQATTKLGGGPSYQAPQEREAAKRVQRKRKRIPVFDESTELSDATIRANLADDSDLLRSPPRRYRTPAKRVPARKLFSMLTCDKLGGEPGLRQLVQRCLVTERERREEFLLDEVSTTKPLSPPTSLMAAETARGNSSALSEGEIEVGRAGTSGHGDDASRNESGVTLSDASGSNLTRISFEVSSHQRTNKLIPPSMGGVLSPIQDESEERLDLEPGLVDVSCGSYSSKAASTLHSPSSSHHSPHSSPSVESKPEAYARHVVTVMGAASVVTFDALLPPGSSRRTAAQAFSHVLALSSSSVLVPRQTEPYGTITLVRGTGF